MTSSLRHLLSSEAGQDMVEYSLLLAFIVVLSAALILQNSSAIAVIWTTTTNYLEKGT